VTLAVGASAFLFLAGQSSGATTVPSCGEGGLLVPCCVQSHGARLRLPRKTRLLL
jgi:hypothetical protein